MLQRLEETWLFANNYLEEGHYESAIELLNKHISNDNENKELHKKLISEGGLRKKLCKRYLTKLDKAKITGISLI